MLYKITSRWFNDEKFESEDWFNTLSTDETHWKDRAGDTDNDKLRNYTRADARWHASQILTLHDLDTVFVDEYIEEKAEKNDTWKYKGFASYIIEKNEDDEYEIKLLSDTVYIKE